MRSDTDLTLPGRATARAAAGDPPRVSLPGAVTYVVLAPWAGAVLGAIVAGVLAGGGAARLALAPPALTAWPLAIFPSIMVPFFAVLHLDSVLQSRHDWDGRVGAYTAAASDG